MVITEYQSKKMLISPKSKKISTSCVKIIFDTKKERYKGRKTKPKKEPYRESGFSVGDLVGEKHNKKRTKSHKFIGQA